MAGRISWLSIAAAVATLLGSACAPAPVSPPSALPTSAPAPAALQPASTPRPEEAAWQKVVAEAKKEGRLTAYDFFLVGDVGLAVSRAFEARYGIQLEMIPGRGAEMLERMKTERRMGKMMADMVGGSSPNTINMKKEGLTAGVSGLLPVFREKDVWSVDPLALDPEGHVMGFNFSNYHGYINTKLMKPEDAPRSLQDYLKPQWKGKIIARDPIISSAEYISFVPLLNRGIIDLAYVKALGEQNLRFHVSPVGSVEMLARGEAPLSLPLSDSTTGPTALTGAPIQAIPLAHGTLAYMSAIAAVKGAPHPNAALVYLNWRFSQEGQSVFGKAAGQASVRKDVTDFRSPAIRAPLKDVIVVTAKDMDDAAQMFQDKVFVPLLKR